MRITDTPGLPLIQITRAGHTYRMGSQSIPVLRDVAFEIHSGKTCAMLGASGSGESTLLNLLGLLDQLSADRFLARTLPFRSGAFLIRQRHGPLAVLD
ncbi:ATP-binding cassette domain-containing protein [Achromobacter xylosoxidans]|uniref:ATP-binding cassette domain-containing protein n=3 Tax=Alcaligenaceae TaxID=506 RepID=UPI0015630E6F|nr:ATP-binding cassette domain-containing protein [Achromobacter xylosoxidans]